MSTDNALLQAYVRERSEDAFAELVRRHLNLVHGAALRETGGDTADAEDLAQAVFCELARKARVLSRHPALAGWLYTAVRRFAANQRRGDRRRQWREHSALAMNDTHESPEELWAQARPVIDDALHELGETDRAAVILRCFEQRSLAEVGQVLGVSENAARMRVDRALERLRGLLARRGVTSTASGLAAALAAGAVFTAPAHLAAAITASAMAAGASTAGTALTFWEILTMTKAKTILVGALTVAAVTVPVWQQTRVSALAHANQDLHRQVAELSPLRDELQRLRSSMPAPEEQRRLREAETLLQNEVASLRARLASLQRAQPAALPAAVTPPTTAEGATNGTAGMAQFVQGVIEQQLEGRLTRMKDKLNLTPAQEETVRALLRRQAEQGAQVAQRMFGGKLTQEDLKAAEQAGVDPEAQIQALLTPEQKAAYTELKHEEAVSNARLAANAEMLMLQSTLSLSNEQQDRVFNALYDQTLAMLDGGVKPPTTADPAAAAKWQIDLKVKALEGVLTPEQLAGYQRQQEQQLKMIQALMPKAAEDAAK